MCSAPPKFLSHNQFFFCCFLRTEAESSFLIIARFFVVRKLQEVITAFALVRRKMRCIKQKRGEIKITYDNKSAMLRKKNYD